MESDNAFIYVSKFLTVKDMLSVTSTCSYFNSDETLWSYFFYYFRLRLNTNEQIFLNKLKFTFYGNNKVAITSYNVQRLWSQWSIPDQLECYSTRKIILLYFIASILKEGKNILYEYNKYMNHVEVRNRYQRRNKIRWSLSTWEILNGNRKHLFRRKYLPVY